MKKDNMDNMNNNTLSKALKAYTGAGIAKTSLKMTAFVIGVPLVITILSFFISSGEEIYIGAYASLIFILCVISIYRNLLRTYEPSSPGAKLSRTMQYGFYAYRKMKLAKVICCVITAFIGSFTIFLLEFFEIYYKFRNMSEYYKITGEPFDRRLLEYALRHHYLAYACFTALLWCIVLINLCEMISGGVFRIYACIFASIASIVLLAMIYSYRTWVDVLFVAAILAVPYSSLLMIYSYRKRRWEV